VRIHSAVPGRCACPNRPRRDETQREGGAGCNLPLTQALCRRTNAWLTQETCICTSAAGTSLRAAIRGMTWWGELPIPCWRRFVFTWAEEVGPRQGLPHNPGHGGWFTEGDRAVVVRLCETCLFTSCMGGGLSTPFPGRTTHALRDCFAVSLISRTAHSLLLQGELRRHSDRFCLAAMGQGDLGAHVLLSSCRSPM